MYSPLRTLMNKDYILGKHKQNFWLFSLERMHVCHKVIYSHCCHQTFSERGCPYLLNQWWGLIYVEPYRYTWNNSFLPMPLVNGIPLQYFCLENPMDREAWWATVHGVARVGHDWATSLSLFTFMHWRRKWQPTTVFLPGESQGWGSLVGCRPWGCTESDTTEAT